MCLSNLKFQSLSSIVFLPLRPLAATVSGSHAHTTGNICHFLGGTEKDQLSRNGRTRFRHYKAGSVIVA